MVADVFGALMPGQPDIHSFKAWGGSLSFVEVLLITDERHHDRPLVHHRSAGLQKYCMKSVQALFLLVPAPAQLSARSLTTCILTCILQMLTDFRTKQRLLAV